MTPYTKVRQESSRPSASSLSAPAPRPVPPPSGPAEIHRLTPDPLVLLGLPASHNSLVGAMLGQHPALYDLPETHLFGFETLADWGPACEGACFRMADGLLRAVARICFGRQDDQSISCAAG